MSNPTIFQATLHIRELKSFVGGPSYVDLRTNEALADGWRLYSRTPTNDTGTVVEVVLVKLTSTYEQLIASAMARAEQDHRLLLAQGLGGW